MNGLVISHLVGSRRLDPKIGQCLASTFGAIAGVTGALLLGSRARGNSHPGSNADVLLVVEQLTPTIASCIAAAKHQAEAELACCVSVNVHTLADADPLMARWGMFMHKNRAELFVYQAKYTSVVLWGRNVFDEFRDPMPAAVRAEAVRVTASFAYVLRKYLFDLSLAPHGAAEFVRTPLIFLEYMAGFYGYISMGFQDGLSFLSQGGVLSRDDLGLLGEYADRKTSSRYADVSQELRIRACDFLERMMLSMADLYWRRGVCDVRWNGSGCELSWDLDLPQAAAMTVIRGERGVLLLKRPDDDYLYPDRWTIPGGYLNLGEPPAAAAAREVAEETGLPIVPVPLMPGEPVVSDRLAAFAFEAELRLGNDRPHLAEHDYSMFADPEQALAMDLTPEARLVLERYQGLHATADGTRAVAGAVRMLDS